MSLVPGAYTSPVAGPILARGAPVRYANGGRATVLGVESTHAHVYDGAADRRIYAPLTALFLDLDTDLGPTVALRWLGRHYGIELGVGCPLWEYVDDDRCAYWRLGGDDGVCFYSPAPGRYGAPRHMAGRSDVVVPNLSTNPLEAIAVACAHAAGAPRE